MTTNASFNPELDTLTIGGIQLPKFEMKLNNVSNLPTQLSFNRKFKFGWNNSMISIRILSYHGLKFRIYVEYDSQDHDYWTEKVELLTPNGWSIILSKVDLPDQSNIMKPFIGNEDEVKDSLNNIINDIEELFINLICLLY